MSRTAEFTNRDASTLPLREGKDRPSICFVAPFAYPALSGRSDLAHIGGAEVQQVHIARALVQRGYPVRFVTLDHGQPDAIEHDGIAVMKAYSMSEGISGMRFFHPRWSGLWRAMARANTDVYYQRAAGAETGQVALWCRLRRRRFYFAVASDDHCERMPPTLTTWRERRLFRYGMTRATRVICQTQKQGRALQSHHGLHSVHIRSCAIDPFDGRRLSRILAPSGKPRVLWVGRFHAKKRLEWFLDLAESLPVVSFEVAGEGRSKEPYIKALSARAARIANLELLGRVPHAQMGVRYDAADLLVCTSHNEGYPNTFLEAWARGTPTVTTFDPDGVVAAHGLGGAAESVSQLRDVVHSLCTSPTRWSECSNRARAFFLEHHSVSAAADGYERLLLENV